MGTNYYVIGNLLCEHCGSKADDLHIGKSSAGWCFGLCIYPEMGIESLDDWKDYLSDKEIKDEYGRNVTIEKLMSIITERSRERNDWTDMPFGYQDWRHFHADNGSMEGPSGMIRHQIDGRFCVGHGLGTWDYMLGEFS